MNWDTYAEFVRRYGHSPARPRHEQQHVPEEMQGREVAMAYYDEMARMPTHPGVDDHLPDCEKISWTPDQTPLGEDERARQHAFNLDAPPERRICLREGACVGDGVQVNWCPTAETWLCASCLFDFSQEAAS